MLDIVSFETAKQLKEAGFPQPELRDGQAWYWKHGDPYFLYYHSSVHALLSPIGWAHAGKRILSKERRDIFFSETAYAPTATDILRELPGANLRWNGSTFFCKYRGETESQNPAEALAQMWLKIFANA